MDLVPLPSPLFPRKSRQTEYRPNGSQASHFPPKAKSVIFLYMDGAPSMWILLITNRLEKYNGQDPRTAIGKLERTQFDNIGTVLKSQWDFKQHGECGHWISSLFPIFRGGGRSGDDQIDDLSLCRAYLCQLLFAHRIRVSGTSQHGGMVRIRAWN